MKNVGRIYLDKHKKFRLDSKKLATVFVVSAFIVAIVVFWWLKLVGITVTGEAFCGLSEHKHSGECYISEVICGFDEALTTLYEESTDDTSLSDEETAEAHTHTEECYDVTLVCTKTEHTHTEECFPDKTADMETVSDWLATLKDVEITNNIPENLVAVALSQVGYEESGNNFEYDSDGNPNGYTRYGEWYGNPYGKWNTMFVAFCLHYSNINNAAELKASGAETMRLAWQQRGVYEAKDEYTPERGDVVFLDTDGDEKADSTAIITSVSDESFVVVMGDSNNRVETKSIEKSDDVMGYGLTGELSFAEDKEVDKEKEELPPEIEETAESKYEQLMLFNSTKATIIEVNDLTTVVKDVHLRTEDGTILGPDSKVYIGQTYVISMTFAEVNTGDTWIQFKHDDHHELHYKIPDNIEFEPFTEWHPITAKTENGTVENVGRYFLYEDGQLVVIFDDDESGLCFGAKYSNVEFTINFNAQIGSNEAGDGLIVDYGNEVKVEYSIDGGAGINATKTHGAYDSDDHTVEYTIMVEATHGLVKDFVLDDQIWENHYTLRDTIVVTDLEGNVLDPQPTISDHPKEGAEGGFRLSDFPDFAAGDGFLITYKTQIYDHLLSNDTVDMWNGLDLTAKDSNGETIYLWKDDWLRVETEKMTKDGKQTIIKDAEGNEVSVIEWEVAIKKNNSNLQGTVVIDTLGEGLQYYTDQPILIKHYDEWGNRLADQHLSWDQVTINGNSMSFPLPDGYMFDIFYYTTYDIPDEGEQQQYNNSVSATINGKYETAGGEADVVGFIPRVNKSAKGDDGEYVYFTIEADVPGVIKDWGNFYFSDLSAFWGYDGNNEGYLYVENMPEDFVITAETKSGKTVTFTPYVAGGPTENTYILEAPTDDMHHSFKVYFNTSEKNNESSKWILSEDSVLTITYKIPFDAKTGTEWTGELSGNKTVGDVLLEEETLANEVYFNYTDVISTTDSTSYKYSPKITKKSFVEENGYIDYEVVFYNTIPGSGGNQGYLVSAYPITFNDTFDEKLEYVEGSLMVTCYDPWNNSVWYNKYVYDGKVSGNTMNIQANEFKLSQTNPDLPSNTISWIKPFTDYQKYCNQIGAGGMHVFTYKLRLKDKYLYSTEHNEYELDNTAEIKWNTDGSSGPATDRVEFETGLVDKNAVQKDNRLDFDIHINRYSLDILKGIDELVIEDTMTPNLSVYWESIKLYYEDENGDWIDFDSTDKYECSVTYDQDSNKLTFVVPDELHIKIDYSTLITESGLVSISNSVSINASAEVTDIIDATFQVQDHSGDASASMHEITLLKQDGTTDVRLPDVTFLLYGPMGDPKATPPDSVDRYIVTDNNKTLGYIGSYTTGADGTVEIKTQYLTVGGPYALVEYVPPIGYNILQKPVYFYFYNPDPDGIIQTVTTLIAVENYSYGFVLPETGGTGTLPLTIIGVALMAFPILYSTIRRKRERRST